MRHERILLDHPAYLTLLDAYVRANSTRNARTLVAWSIENHPRAWPALHFQKLQVHRTTLHAHTFFEASNDQVLNRVVRNSMFSGKHLTDLIELNLDLHGGWVTSGPMVLEFYLRQLVRYFRALQGGEKVVLASASWLGLTKSNQVGEADEAEDGAEDEAEDEEEGERKPKSKATKSLYEAYDVLQSLEAGTGDGLRHTGQGQINASAVASSFPSPPPAASVASSSFPSPPLSASSASSPSPAPVRAPAPSVSKKSRKGIRQTSDIFLPFFHFNSKISSQSRNGTLTLPHFDRLVVNIGRGQHSTLTGMSHNRLFLDSWLRKYDPPLPFLYEQSGRLIVYRADFIAWCLNTKQF
eukprot:TRINITY_DN7399_c0_g2_i2.p1 TRINITY_DN7399_c0_g2~~TRINITY_DN7399_c0_g2_i2.p1  ORF type:complete len:354 (+),score=64.51 TRINITY_DN7399_c0_g2_i2:81-1142(+)